VGDDYPIEDQGPEGLPNPFGDDDVDPAGGDRENLVSVAGVYEHRSGPEDQAPDFVVLVRDDAGRTVVIVIGRFEAMAISLALEGQNADRPLTHDLLNSTIQRLGGNIERIVIDDLWNGTYYAKIQITSAGASMLLDSRPSDAIALALRAKAPIYMLESVLEKASMSQQQ
jgi:uncharacterized protein